MKDEGGHTFSETICPKVNTLARLEFKLAFYGIEVQLACHYTALIHWLVCIRRLLQDEIIQVKKWNRSLSIYR